MTVALLEALVKCLACSNCSSCSSDFQCYCEDLEPTEVDPHDTICEHFKFEEDIVLKDSDEKKIKRIIKRLIKEGEI